MKYEKRLMMVDRRWTLLGVGVVRWSRYTVSLPSVTRELGEIKVTIRQGHDAAVQFSITCASKYYTR